MPEPLPRSSSTAACEEGTKGLSLSKEGSVYVSACISVLISVTLLPALVLCQQEVRASSTLPSDRHTHTKGAAIALHPGTSPNPAWLPLPAARGNTHQLHLGTQSFQDPVGSFCLLLQGGKGRGKTKLFVPSVTGRSSLLQLSPLLKPLLRPPQSRHKSHPCLRVGGKVQLSLWTRRKNPWAKGSGTRVTVTLMHPSSAQEVTQIPDPSGCQAGGLCPLPLRGCPASGRAGKPARTQRCPF